MIFFFVRDGTGRGLRTLRPSGRASGRRMGGGWREGRGVVSGLGFGEVEVMLSAYMGVLGIALCQPYPKPEASKLVDNFIQGFEYL